VAADRPGRGATAAGASASSSKPASRPAGSIVGTAPLPDSSAQPPGRVVEEALEEALEEAVVDRNAGAAHRTGADGQSSVARRRVGVGRERHD